MSAEWSDTASVVERTQPVETGGSVVAAYFLGRTAAFVLGEEAIVLAPPASEPRRLAVHGGAILSSVADAARIVSGGDDGKIVATDANGESRVLATDPGVLAKIELGLRSRRPVDGHAPGVRGKDLCAYVAAGIDSDHETIELRNGKAPPMKTEVQLKPGEIMEMKHVFPPPPPAPRKPRAAPQLRQPTPGEKLDRALEKYKWW